MTNVTRGELVRAEVINLSTNEKVQCMFNPHEYTLTKSNSWNVDESASQKNPTVQYKSTSGQKLTLKLYFDTLGNKEDVRVYTDALWRMMEIDKGKADPKSNKASPPEVAFKWGRFYFRSVITSMTQKFTLFDPKGVPVRCNVSLTLEQKIDVDDYNGNPPKLTGKTAAKQAGDRIDNLLTGELKPTSENMRKLMEENNIDNPLNIASGVVISLGGSSTNTATGGATNNGNVS